MQYEYATHIFKGTCAACNMERELRYGICYECANAAEQAAANRLVIEHLARGIWRTVTLKFDFTTQTCYMWAWERLTRTGDYEPGGVFEREYGIKL